MLIAWFALTRRSQEAHRHMYADTPDHYTYKQQWQPRRRDGARVIGRLVSVGATDV